MALRAPDTFGSFLAGAAQSLDQLVPTQGTRKTGSRHRSHGRLASGRLEEEVPYSGRGDEVGEMARALSVFKDQALQNRRNDENAKHIITVLGQGLENLAKGNLTHRIDSPFPDALDKLRQYFNSAADSLADTINTVKRGSFGIKSGTEEIAQASDKIGRAHV